MMKNKNNDVITYTHAIPYYQILQENIMDIRESIKDDKLREAILCFNGLVNLTFFFTYPLMDNNDKIILDMNDLLSHLPSGNENTDYQRNINNAKFYDVLNEYNKRERILYKLMSKAKLFVPFTQTQDLSKAIMVTR